VTLADARPPIAIIDRDSDHAACVQTLSRLSSPHITSWPAFVEAMSLLGQRISWVGQEHLWRLVLRNDLNLMPVGLENLSRIRDLMDRWAL
jgi:hypothetical protein